MKNKLRFLGIIATVAIIGLSMTGCEEGDDLMRITVTGLAAYNGNSAQLELRNAGGGWAAHVPMVARGPRAPVQNGSARFEIMTSPTGSVPFETSGTYDITLRILNDAGLTTRIYLLSNRNVARFGGSVPLGNFTNVH